MPGFRCSDSARERGDRLTGTAVPAVRYLLLEVPGPWPRDARTRLDPLVVEPLARAAGAAGARLLLVRRPGRHPSGAVRDKHWALADTRPGVEAVQWGTWRTEGDLQVVDPAGRVDPDSARASGPQHVALVCTHGSRDVCCAVRGRPVAAALARVVGLDVWETTHVGGCRFAANAVLLPTGDMVGGLDADSAPEVVARWREGVLDAGHHRGRSGSTPVAQAVVRLTADALGEPRPDAVEVRSLGATGTARVDAEIRHRGRRYRARIEVTVGTPQPLTCAAAAREATGRAHRYELVSLDPLE